jgi:hypothetical protein
MRTLFRQLLAALCVACIGCSAQTQKPALPTLPSAADTSRESLAQCSSFATEENHANFRQFMQAHRYNLTPQMMNAYYIAHHPSDAQAVRIVQGSYTLGPGGVRSYDGTVAFYMPCAQWAGTVRSLLVYPSGYVTMSLGKARFRMYPVPNDPLSTVTVDSSR